MTKPWRESLTVKAAGSLLAYAAGSVIGGVIESRTVGPKAATLKSVYGVGCALSFIYPPASVLVLIPVLELTAGFLFNHDHRLWSYKKVHNLAGHIAWPQTAGLAAAAVATSVLMR